MASALSEPVTAEEPVGDLIDLELRGAPRDSGTRFNSKEYVHLKARVESIRTVAEMTPMLDELMTLVMRHQTDERLQRLVAVALGRAQDPRAAMVWRGIDRRFPESDVAPIRVVRDIYKTRGYNAAEAYIQQRLGHRVDGLEDRFLLARAQIEVRQIEAAEVLLKEIVENSDTEAPLLIKTTQLLLKHGRLSEAENASQLLVSKFGAKPAHIALLHQTDNLRNIVGDATSKSMDVHLSPIIEKVFDVARQRGRRDLVTEPFTSLGSVVMITGSLAPGGAERQFVTTALGLHHAAETGAQIAGFDIQGPLTLICRSLRSRADDDFFLPKLRDVGIDVHEYSTFEPFGGRAKRSLSRSVSSLLSLLPNEAQFGVVHLADMLRFIAPDVVHIWQDGSILATGVAAVLAGVPRIVLGARTMPPTGRHDREKPEYHSMFRGLLNEPGVLLVSNSRLVAGRYAEWLDIDRRKVRVIPNGVAQPDPTPKPASLELVKSLPPRSQRFVIGGVMRFSAVKRPLFWVECAAAILAKCPDAYFVMLGRGPLLEAAMARVRELGMMDRFIFTGATTDVGFWFSQMDVLLLLSRYEGLPNVLIEAQMCGVPVVTTPSGGSAETVDDGITGAVLPSIEIEDPNIVADAVLNWRRDPTERDQLGKVLWEWASSQFSVERMLESTVQTYME